MNHRIELIKGIHPGKLIERDLRKRGITQLMLAANTGIEYHTINEIIAGKRNLTIEQATKIESFMGYDEGFLSQLQTYYDIKQNQNIKNSRMRSQTPPHIRRIVFWDTDMDKIDWKRNKIAIINRVLERGNKEETDEIMRYYRLTESDLMKFKPRFNRLTRLTTKDDK
jgi:addiction module HigA family antidote